MYYYEIANLGISMDCNFNEYVAFQIEKEVFTSKNETIKIWQIDNYDGITISNLVANSTNLVVYECEDINQQFCWCYKDFLDLGSLFVSKDYSKAIYYSKLDRDTGIYYSKMYQLINCLVQCKLSMMGYLVLHASCVKINDYAVLFTAKSGTGKSTRAFRWMDTLNAIMISGDRPLVNPITGMVFGVPWDGKEKVYVKEKTPVLGLLLLYRSNKTNLEKLDKLSMLKFLCTQCFIPMWDSGLTQKVFISINALLNNDFIYKVECDQTSMAAIEVYNSLLERNNENTNKR